MDERSASTKQVARAAVDVVAADLEVDEADTIIKAVELVVMVAATIKVCSCALVVTDFADVFQAMVADEVSAALSMRSSVGLG